MYIARYWGNFEAKSCWIASLKFATKPVVEVEALKSSHLTLVMARCNQELEASKWHSRPKQLRHSSKHKSITWTWTTSSWTNRAPIQRSTLTYHNLIWTFRSYSRSYTQISTLSHLLSQKIFCPNDLISVASWNLRNDFGTHNQARAAFTLQNISIIIRSGYSNSVSRTYIQLFLEACTVLQGSKNQATARSSCDRVGHLTSKWFRS